ASYGNGTFRYDYGSNHWTKLTTATASALSAARDNTFFGSLGNGTYEYNGSWHRLTTDVANKLAAVSNNDVYASFSSGGDRGTWQYKRGWHGVTTAVPVAMDASPGGALFFSDSAGTSEYNGSLHRITSLEATNLAAVSNSEFYATFSSTASAGTWE